MVQRSKPKNQQRTAIVYFCPQRDDYLRWVEAADSAAFLRLVQHPRQQQLQAEKHRADCPDRSCYSSHGKRERTVPEWLGGQTVVPIYRVRCCGCGVLKHKQFLFTDYLNFPNASPFLAPLHRSMRFLAQKLQTFGEFWASSKVNATLHAWAIVNHLRTFLPSAKRGGKSLVEMLGAKLQGIPGMEALNLSTVGRLSDLVPASG